MERQYKKLTTEYDLKKRFVTKQEKTIFNSYKEALKDIKKFTKKNLKKESKDTISFNFYIKDGKITDFYYSNQNKEISVSYKSVD